MARKDEWNANQPSEETQFLQFVQHPELAKLLPILYPKKFPHLEAFTGAARRPRGDPADRDPAGRGSGLPERQQQRRLRRHAAAERRGAAGEGTPTRSGSSAATSPATRTDAASPTTSRTSRSRPSPAPRYPLVNKATTPTQRSPRSNRASPRCRPARRRRSPTPPRRTAASSSRATRNREGGIEPCTTMATATATTHSHDHASGGGELRRPPPPRGRRARHRGRPRGADRPRRRRHARRRGGDQRHRARRRAQLTRTCSSARSTDVPAYTAVFDKIREGSYTLWVDDCRARARVAITGGAVSELDWSTRPLARSDRAGSAPLAA